MNEDVNLTDGGLRFAIFIEGIWPTDEQIDRIWKIDGVEEVSSSHVQNYKVIFKLDAAADFNDALYQRAKDDIRNLL